MAELTVRPGISPELAKDIAAAIGTFSSPAVFPTQEIIPFGIVTGAAYADLDAMGTVAIRVAVPPSGIIQSAIYFDRDDEGLQVDLWLFDDDVADQVDNDPFALSDGNLLHVLDVISFSSFSNANTGQFSRRNSLGIDYNVPKGFIWCQLQARGALNIAAGALPIFKLGILPDA